MRKTSTFELKDQEIGSLIAHASGESACRKSD